MKSVVRMLAIQKTDDMPNEIWANIELILKNTHLKLHVYSTKCINQEQYEVIYAIDGKKGLNLNEVASLAEELALHYKIVSLRFDPCSTIFTNKSMYPQPTCKIELTLNH